VAGIGGASARADARSRHGCRQRHFTKDIVVTDLPLHSMHRLSRPKYFVFKSIVVPSCRLSLSQVLDRAERVNEGIVKLSAAYDVKLCRLNPAWYGFDPIHIRPSRWRSAWTEILGAPPHERVRLRLPFESLKLYLMSPERRWVFGVEQFTPQSGVALPSGGRVWLY
jgi:hypothetical protein